MEQLIGLVTDVTEKTTKTQKVYYALSIDGKKGFSWNKHFAEANNKRVKYTEEVSKLDASAMSYEFIEFADAPTIHVPAVEEQKADDKSIPNGKQAEFVRSALAAKALELAVNRTNALPHDQTTTNSILVMADVFLKWLNEKSI